MNRRVLALFTVLALTACAAPATTSTPTAVSLPTVAPGTARLVVMTHDSFNATAAVIQQFEQQHNVKVEFLKAGDAGAALNKAILAKDAPLADVFFGVDNTLLSRAVASGIFAPYQSPAAAAIPANLRLDPTNALHPVDYGYVTLNYDRAALEKAGLQPPQTLRDLTKPEWKSKLVVENPATSSPGLAFLLASVATFGERGDYTYQDFWRELRANDVLVTEGWEDAYNREFSGSAGKGPRPLVVSYATSPAAEVFFSEGKLTEPPTGNVLAGAFLQVEFVGVLRGAKQPVLAQQFVDFMLSAPFQQDIPLNMFVYPALPGTPQPDVFQRFAQLPPEPVSLAPAAIATDRERWVTTWTSTVLR